MAAQQMKMSVLIDANASGIKAGGVEAAAALDKIKVAADAAGKSVQQLISDQAGLSKVAGDAALPADNLKAYGAQLDALRAKYNPLYAVISRYKAEVINIRAAQAGGALTANEMTAAIDRERRATLASIDAIKGRNTALRSMPAANSNQQSFQTSNIAAQFQDIGVTAAMGMSPLQIALQQGTQLSSIVAGMKNPIAGIGAAFVSLVSPVSLATMATVGLSAAAIQYFTSASDGAENVNELLDKQNDIIRNAAQLWGDAVPAFRAYVDELDRAAKLKAGQDATSALVSKSFAELPPQMAALTESFTQATRSLDQTNIGADQFLELLSAYTNLKKHVADNTASMSDLNRVQTALSDAIATSSTPKLKLFEEQWNKVTSALRRASEEAGKAREEFLKSVSGGVTVQDIVDNNRVTLGDRTYPAGAFTPKNAPVPGEKPSMLDFDPNEEANKKLTEARKKAADEQERQNKAYQDYIATQIEGIARAELERSLIGATSAERQRQIALFEAEIKIRELGLTSASKEAQLIREKAVALAAVNQQIAAQKFDQDQSQELEKLRQQASLIGLSAQAQARANAIYEAEARMRQEGISLLDQEADRRRAVAVQIADQRLQIERQQAAYQSLQQAEGSAIDALVTGTGTLKERLKGMADSMLQWFEQIAIANPLKNALTGTNLPTIGDLLSGKTTSLSATNTGTMTVNAATVMINGAPLGVPGTANPLVNLFGANNNQPAAANTNNPVAAVLGNAGTTKTGLPLSSISSAAGQTVSVNSQYAGNFQGFVNELQARGYQINSLGGYNYRNIAGTNTLSNHAFGNAIDINPAQNPVTYPGRGQSLVTDLPPDVGDIASKYGLQQGIWKNKYDPMHFEVAKGAQPMPIDQNVTKLSQTAANASQQIDKMGTGAIDASKALTEGNNSLVGSITKASQTAQSPTAGAATGSGLAGAGAPATSGISSLFSGISSAIGGMLKGIVGLFSSLFKGVGSIFGSLFGGLFANGGVFAGGNVIRFASGGVFDKPTLFPMAGGRTGMLGEAGPEAIMPLRRGADGKLGVVSAMPRQAREGGGAMRMHLSSEINLHISGTTDAELRAQSEQGIRTAIEQNNRQWEVQLPDMIDAWRRDQQYRRSVA